MDGAHTRPPVASGDGESISPSYAALSPKYKKTFKASWIKSSCPVPVDMERTTPSAAVQASSTVIGAPLLLSDSQASTVRTTNTEVGVNRGTNDELPDCASAQQHTASPPSPVIPNANEEIEIAEGEHIQPVHSTPRTPQAQQAALSRTGKLDDIVSSAEPQKSSSSKKMKMQKLKKLFVTSTNNGSQPGSPGQTPLAPRTATSRHIWPFAKTKGSEKASATPAPVIPAPFVPAGLTVPPAAPKRPVRREHRDMASSIPQRVTDDVHSMSIYNVPVFASPVGTPSPLTRGHLGPSPVSSVWRGSRKGTGPSPQSTMSYDSGDILARPPSFAATYSPGYNYLGHAS